MGHPRSHSWCGTECAVGDESAEVGSQRDSSARENTGPPNDDEVHVPEGAGHGIPRGVYLDAFVRRAA